MADRRTDFDISGIQAMDRATAGRLAAAEYARFAELLDSLDDHDWELPTDCPPWTVRQIAAHVLGATEANASSWEMVRQLRHGRSGFAIEVDPVGEFQVREREWVPPAELLRRFRLAAPRAVAGRMRWARLAGAVPLKVGAPVHETWRLRYLMNRIYTRDTWMHRVDLCRATGREMVLTGDHDGRLIADLVAEWASRHGRPFRLSLAGPAGGTYCSGTDGEEMTVDAVEFARTLSGRSGATGLLRTPVPF